MENQEKLVMAGKRRRKPRHYVAATLFALLAVAGFFCIGANRSLSSDSDTMSRQEIEVEPQEKVAFAERAEDRLEQMKRQLNEVDPVANEGELALEIEALSTEIEALDSELDKAERTMSPAEKERMETTLINLERRVKTLNTPVGLLEIQPLTP